MEENLHVNRWHAHADLAARKAMTLQELNDLNLFHAFLDLLISDNDVEVQKYAKAGLNITGYAMDKYDLLCDQQLKTTISRARVN